MVPSNWRNKIMFKLINNKTISINNVIIVFPCSIKTNIYKEPFVLQKNGLIIVNFYPSTQAEDHLLNNMKINMKSNIWAFNLHGHKIWEIEESPANSIHENPYTSIYEEDGRIIAGSIGGFDHVVDISNGTVELIKGGRPW
jgi:hypothetical protein